MRKKRNDWVVGIILISIGLYFFLNQFFDIPGLENLAIYFLLGLGILFLAWGIITRSEGLMVPGGILTGIGLGVVLIAGPMDLGYGGMDGSVFLGAFAFGWVLITLFTALFTDRTLWWPLIPAAIMAVIGGAIMIQGPYLVILEWLGRLWPLALIAGGIAILWSALKMRGKRETAPEPTEAEEYDIDQLKADES